MGAAAKTTDHLLVNEPQGSTKATLVLAHGAGSPMDAPSLSFLAESFAAGNIRVVRFEFPYMRLRRAEGQKKPPDPPEILMGTWRNVIGQLGGAENLIIGGKSMGGRIASMIADEQEACGLVCFGYPFHPPGKPERLRIQHLKQLKTPTLILQGERDPFGGQQEVSAYTLSSRIQIVWIADGDHSFKPCRQSGRTERQNLEQVVSHTVNFIVSLSTS